MNIFSIVGGELWFHQVWGAWHALLPADVIRVVRGVEAVLAVDVVQPVGEELPLSSQVLYELTHDCRAADTVLIHVDCADTKPDCLLVAEKHVLSLRRQLDGPISNPFKARQRVIKLVGGVQLQQRTQTTTDLEALNLRHGSEQARADVGCDHVARDRVDLRVLLAVALPDPRSEEGADFVAVEDAPRAVKLLLGHGKAVGVRVVGEDVA